MPRTDAPPNELLSPRARGELAERLRSLADAFEVDPAPAPDMLALGCRRAGRSLLDLAGQVTAAACPGPHEPRQHRDSLPRWCRACRRTVLGEPIDELPPRPRPGQQ